MSVEKQMKQAKEAAIKLASASSETKNKALKNIIINLKKNKNKIFSANKKDVEAAKKFHLQESLIKRLVIDDVKFKEMVNELKDVIKLEDPVGKTLSVIELDKGLVLSQITCSIGVIGTIFESRPDALMQIASLCIKSGNAVVLKGGSEALNSNRALYETILKATNNVLPKGSIQLIETRQQVKQILKLNQYIDLLIPRGSNKFVKYIQENTKIPVLGHSDGICHVYVDEDADLKKAINVCFDSKCQYSAVCNAMETMLVHKKIADKFLPKMIKKFKQANVEIRADNKTKKIVKSAKSASEQDWKTEYNDLILSVKVVNDADDAINHINKYGSKHTDAIITEDDETASKFIEKVDSASIMRNASTRFADGFRYGKGAEVGISTAKIHSRGPVGLEGLVIYKYVLVGKGQVVSSYAGNSAKKFTHRRIK